MKCPHCREGFHSKPGESNLLAVKGFQWSAFFETCPECGDPIVSLKKRHLGSGKTNTVLVYPRAISRGPLPPEIKGVFREDYTEACLVLGDSPKASAAISRRCLQNILREKAGVKHQNLSNEIVEVLPKLPSHLADAVDAIRNIGNFAAHPLKSTNSGEILDVEPGEADWLLEVLEQLLDFYFVQPERLKAKRAALNEKLAEAGKPPVK